MHMSRPNFRAGVSSGRAFTLVELLVVIAVIALLIGVLLPALGQAQKAGWALVSSNNQRQFMIGIQTYATENKEFIPSMSAPGRIRLTEIAYGVGGTEGDLFNIVNRDGTAPLAANDWLTPGIAQNTQLPPEWSARWWTILEDFGDPAMKERSPVWDGSAASLWGSEIEDYARNVKSEPFRGVSYLMNTVWLGYGDLFPNRVVRDLSGSPDTNPNFGRYLRFGSGSPGGAVNQVIPPASYSPRTVAIQSPSDKIAISTGFRYFDVSGVDWDPRWQAGATVTFGAMTDTSPVFERSTAYGKLSPSNGENIPLTYRHNGDLICAMWDGSVRRVTRAESFDPTLWFPTKSQFVGGSGTAPESLEFYNRGELIN